LQTALLMIEVGVDNVITDYSTCSIHLLTSRSPQSQSLPPFG
jgi:hypothetical protein